MTESRKQQDVSLAFNQHSPSPPPFPKNNNYTRQQQVTNLEVLEGTERQQLGFQVLLAAAVAAVAVAVVTMMMMMMMETESGEVLELENCSVLLIQRVLEEEGEVGVFAVDSSQSAQLLAMLAFLAPSPSQANQRVCVCVCECL